MGILCEEGRKLTIARTNDSIAAAATKPLAIRRKENVALCAFSILCQSSGMKFALTSRGSQATR
jgi:hypothetical protein